MTNEKAEDLVEQQAEGMLNLADAAERLAAQGGDLGAVNLLREVAGQLRSKARFNLGTAAKSDEDAS